MLPHILYFIHTCTIVYIYIVIEFLTMPFFLGGGGGGKFTQLEIISGKEHGILADFQNH